MLRSAPLRFSPRVTMIASVMFIAPMLLRLLVEDRSMPL
jgi:hypothetical protein